MVSNEAVNAGAFGYRLGLLDLRFEFLRDIAEATRTLFQGRSLLFLGGYLQAVFKVSPETVQKELIRWSKIKSAVELVPELAWRSGVSEHTSRMILDLLSRKRISTTSVGVFRFGRVIEHFPLDQFQILTKLLVKDCRPESAEIAIDLFFHYFENRKDIPVDLALDVLTNPALHFANERKNSSMSDYFWAKLALLIVKINPSGASRLLDVVIKRSGAAHGFLTHASNELYEATVEMLKGDALGSWGVVLKLLGNRVTDSTLIALRWISGGSYFDTRGGYWRMLPLNELWKWVEKDITARAFLIARVAPQRLDGSADAMVTHELIERYGDRKEVTSQLLSRFYTGGWSGYASDHYESQKRSAELWKVKVKEKKTLKWISEYISSLEESIKHSKIREERGGF